jgi:4-hydroxy-2-oxoheptanedioate aldolase
MLNPNSLKAKLRNGHMAVGCFLITPSADNAEILAHAGFDFLLIDHEHGSGSIVDAIGQMRAMKGTGTANMVRCPANDPAYFKRILDAGAQSVLCPMIETKTQAKDVVRACRFPPGGSRGAGGGTRASTYGQDAGYHDNADDDLLIAVQIESALGVANIEEIANVPGVDMLLIGPRDLSASLGKLNNFQDPEMLSLMETAEKRILSAGKFLGSVIYPGLTAHSMFSKGYQLLIVGSDVAFLTQAARAALPPQCAGSVPEASA